VSISVDELQEEFYDKNSLTLKDWVILKMCFALKVDARAVKHSWDSIFEEVEKLAGTRLENVPLARLWKEDKGRSPTQKADLVAKFCALSPYLYVKKRELEKAKSEYLRDVRIKDKQNPYYKQAIRKASTVACMRVKRAFDAFNKGLENDPWFEIFILMMDQIQKELAKSKGERCTMDDIAERAGGEFAQKFLQRKY
jgi:hypothetical protein